MKTLRYIIGIFFLTAVASLQAQPSSYSFSEGLAKAKSSDKKVLVEIFYPTDSWSEKMDEVYKNETVKSFVESNFIFIKLDASSDGKITYQGKEHKLKDLTNELGATGYPTHVFLESNGNLIKFKYNGETVSAFAGYLDVKDFLNMLKYFLESKYKDTDLSNVF